VYVSILKAAIMDGEIGVLGSSLLTGSS